MDIIKKYCDGSAGVNDVVSEVECMEGSDRLIFTKDLLYLVLGLLDDLDNIGYQYGDVDEELAKDHNSLLSGFYQDVQNLI